MADSPSPRIGFAGAAVDGGKVRSATPGEIAPAATCAPLFKAWRGSSIARSCDLSVARPSDIGRRAASVEDEDGRHNLSQRTPA